MRSRKKIVREMPPIGSKLKGKFFGKQYEAKIVEDDTSPIGRSVNHKGKLFRSLTAAAKDITKQPVNGWRFWKID
jgi:hypothetical protein